MTSFLTLYHLTELALRAELNVLTVVGLWQVSSRSSRVACDGWTLFHRGQSSARGGRWLSPAPSVPWNVVGNTTASGTELQEDREGEGEDKIKEKREEKAGLGIE